MPNVGCSMKLNQRYESGRTRDAEVPLEMLRGSRTE
jgi:hypothetical protein